VHRGDVRDLDLPAEGYDAVFVWHCFEQVPDPYGLLRRIRGLLRPGGLLLLRTPNAEYYGAALAGLREASPRDRRRLAEHLAFCGLLPFPFALAYPPRTLARLAAACGFVDVRVGGSPSVPGADPTYRRWARLKARLLARWAARALRADAADGIDAPWLEVTALRGYDEPA
jgi:SAM-dependent methyltransferase